MRRTLRWAAWYLSIGIAVGTGRRQAGRPDPGFEPLFTAITPVFAWPVALAWDLQSFVAHYVGSERR